VTTDLEQEFEPATSGIEVLGALAKSELDVAITTAKNYPRSITSFQSEVRKMCCLNEDVAEECLYALPRKDKDGKKVNIEGPSIRMAEIILSAWGNARAVSRVLSTEGDSVIAQGVFVDLQRNVTVSKEVRRRITRSNGSRYSEDMISVTANAASSIAVRNAILAGIPKAFWNAAYEDAKKTAVGTLDTLEQRRNGALDWLKSKGVEAARVFGALDVAGLDDIGLDELGTLRALVANVKSGDMTVDAAFPKLGGEETETPRKGTRGLKAALAGKEAPTEAKLTERETAPGPPSVPLSRRCSKCDQEAVVILEGVNYCADDAPDYTAKQ